jgi:hypothetical protein
MARSFNLSDTSSLQILVKHVLPRLLPGVATVLTEPRN